MTKETIDADYGPSFLGKVIRITGKQTLLVNVGNSKLNVGDKIEIYELGDEIKDIDGTILCRYEFIKEELEVVHTTEKYSMCKKTKTKTIEAPFSTLTLSPLFSSSTEYTPLNIDKSDIQELKIKNPIVKVGDPVKKLDK